MTYRDHHISLAWLPDGSWRPSIDGKPLPPSEDRELALALARHTVDQLSWERDGLAHLRAVESGRAFQ